MYRSSDASSSAPERSANSAGKERGGREGKEGKKPKEGKPKKAPKPAMANGNAAGQTCHRMFLLGPCLFYFCSNVSTQRSKVGRGWPLVPTLSDNSLDLANYFRWTNWLRAWLWASQSGLSSVHTCHAHSSAQGPLLRKQLCKGLPPKVQGGHCDALAGLSQATGRKRPSWA